MDLTRWLVGSCTGGQGTQPCDRQHNQLWLDWDMGFWKSETRTERPLTHHITSMFNRRPAGNRFSVLPSAGPTLATDSIVLPAEDLLCLVGYRKTLNPETLQP